MNTALVNQKKRDAQPPATLRALIRSHLLLIVAVALAGMSRLPRGTLGSDMSRTYLAQLAGVLELPEGELAWALALPAAPSCP
jgi:hypothetical protein